MTSHNAAAAPQVSTPNPEPNGQPTVVAAASPPNNSPHPGPSRLPKARRWGLGAKLLAGLIVLALLVLVGGGGYYLFAGPRGPRADLLTHAVRYENLELTIVERGALESAENSDIYCRVKAKSQNVPASTIKWVIDDGSIVKAGDKLMELDDSSQQDQLKTQQIAVDNAYAAWIEAEGNFKVQQITDANNIAAAEVVMKVAQIKLAEYIDGLYKQAKRQIEGQLELARSDLEMWQERSSWSSRMSMPGRRYVTSAQAESDQARRLTAKIALDKVKDDMRVLEEYTKQAQITTLQGDIDKAKAALDAAKKQAQYNADKLDAMRKSKLSVLEQERDRYNEIKDEIKKCTIFSPQDGLVVYYIPENSRFSTGSSQSTIAQGEPVKEGQKLMRIPNLMKMLVTAKVHEAMVSRVRGEHYEKTGFSDAVHAALFTPPSLLARLGGLATFTDQRSGFADSHRQSELRLIDTGQKAMVRVDAFPTRLLQGHVKSVATVASKTDWLSSDVKVYQTMIAIDESMPGLKPEMSAEVTIHVDTHADHVLAVPLQAILGTSEMGHNRKCFVELPDGRTEERDIVVGLTNDTMAEIKEGLKEGDLVVLNPRALMTEQDKARLGTPLEPNTKKGPRGFGKGGKGKDGKGKAGMKGKGPGMPPGGPGGMSPGGGRGAWRKGGPPTE